MLNLRTFCPGHTGSHWENNVSDDKYVKVTQEMARHLKEMGWWERIYVYMHDEPTLYVGAVERIAYDVSLMKEGDPDWETRTMATSHWVKEIQYSTGIWCPLTSNFDNWNWSLPEYGREEYREEIDKGDKLWFYVCNATAPPYAGYDIDTIHGQEPRIVKWQSWYEGASGFLFWHAVYWVKSDPWRTLTDLVTWEQGARVGDGFLVYPGDNDGTAGAVWVPPELATYGGIDGPVITHRLMMIREGLEDWEYLLMAEDRGGKGFARVVTEGFYTQLGINQAWYDPDNPPYSYDEEDLYQARSLIARFIASGGAWGRGDDDDDGDGLCSLGAGRSRAGAMSLATILGIIAVIQLVFRIKHRRLS